MPSVKEIMTKDYDSYRRMTSRTDGAGTFGFGYDLNSRVTMINGPWAGDNVVYDYDDLGRIKTVTPDGGQTTTYTYDSFGRTETIQWGADTFTYIYNGASPLVESIQRPNGSTTEYLYDNQLKRLTDVINKDDTSTVINSFGYTYNNMDLKADETITRGAPIASMTERLITYTYNNVNQVTDSGGTTGPRTYTHEDDGGMTQGYTPEGYPFDATYDAEGRLTSVEYIDSGSVIHRTEYTYGADSLLYVIKKFENGSPTDTTRIVRAGFLPIQERDENNEVIREYVWGPSMGGGIGGLLAMKENGSTYYYLYDGKGNVTALINTQGNVVAAYSYDPFGVLMEKTGSLDQPFRFSTKRYDGETGLSYYGLGEAGGINLYGFVGNNAINGIDPLGLEIVYTDAESEAILKPMVNFLKAIGGNTEQWVNALDGYNTKFYFNTNNIGFDITDHINNRMTIDPDYNRPINTTEGEKCTNALRKLLHEMGHFLDPFLSEEDIINKYENALYPIDGMYRTSH
jgi:YD repeat-containing protein